MPRRTRPNPSHTLFRVIYINQFPYLFMVLRGTRGGTAPCPAAQRHAPCSPETGSKNHGPCGPETGGPVTPHGSEQLLARGDLKSIALNSYVLKGFSFDSKTPVTLSSANPEPRARPSGTAAPGAERGLAAPHSVVPCSSGTGREIMVQACAALCRILQEAEGTGERGGGGGGCEAGYKCGQTRRHAGCERGPRIRPFLRVLNRLRHPPSCQVWRGGGRRGGREEDGVTGMDNKQQNW